MERRSLTFPVAHDPYEENYHHSEVSTAKNGTRCLKGTQVSQLVKREFRQRLAEAMVVIKAYVPQENDLKVR